MQTLVYEDRHNTDSVKWDTLGRKYKNPGLLSMWIADMDFRAPECVQQALESYVQKGVFGYYLPPADYFQSFIDWERDRYGASIEKEWLRFSPGAVSALGFCLCALSDEDSAVVVMPPVYPAFLSVPKELGRELVTCPLLRDGERYSINFEGLEKAFASKNASALIFCSPHNPVGRVWTERELRRVLELCRKYNVLLISDEVHQDLCHPGHKHMPMPMFDEYSDLVVCVTSSAKTFNLAACRTAMMIIPDAGKRGKLDALMEKFETTKASAFAYIAIQAAYRGGGEWLDAALSQIRENDAYVRSTLLEAVPCLSIAPLEGTYLLWIDFSNLVPTEEFHSFIENECGLAVNYGDSFGDPAYCCFIRMNIATSAENVRLAVANIISALKKRGLA